MTRQAVHAQAGSPVWRSQLSFSSRCYFSSFELKDHVADIGYVDQRMCMDQYIYMDHYMCMDQCKDQVGDIGYVVAVMGGSREVAAS